MGEWTDVIVESAQVNVLLVSTKDSANNSITQLIAKIHNSIVYFPTAF